VVSDLAYALPLEPGPEAAVHPPLAWSAIASTDWNNEATNLRTALRTGSSGVHGSMPAKDSHVVVVAFHGFSTPPGSVSRLFLPLPAE
jgi:hypothetical protein